LLTRRVLVRRRAVSLWRNSTAFPHTPAAPAHVGPVEVLMRAILRSAFGGPEVLVIREIPEPEPKEGHAVIQVKAFGLNHAELHMRKGEWAEIADVSGIECVGVVKSCPGGEFAPGTKVAALMGGLGRTINGSYAEYTRAPVTNLALIESG